MREPVLNSVSIGLGIECLVDALEATADLELGLIALISSNHLQRQIRLHAPPNEIEVINGITLYEVFQELCQRTPDRGRFLMRMVMKFPIEDNVTDEELESLIDWRVRDYPDSLSLVLCAMSEAKIAVSLTRDDGWAVSPLKLTLSKETEERELTVEKSIPNLYSFCNARELVHVFNQSLLNTIDPITLWNQREVLFPSLRFGPRVSSDLQRVGPQVYRAALWRLFELNLAAGEWSSGDHPVPRYLSVIRRGILTPFLG